MVPQLLLDFGEGHEGGDDRKSSGPPLVRQVGCVREGAAERTESPLLAEVLRSETLREAWKQVRANKGAAGVDGPCPGGDHR